VRLSLAALGPQPPNFRLIVGMNRGPLAEHQAVDRAMTPGQLEKWRDEGAIVVDTRTDLQFDEAHIPGAIAITALRTGFGTRLAWLAPPGQAIVLVGRDDEDARRAARLASAVGVDGVVGHLGGGMTAWREEGRPVARIERLDVPGLASLLEAEPAVQVLDVREEAEWRRGHLPGSVNRPYHDLREPVAELDAGRPVAVICASGQRSAVGASLVRRQGVGRVIHVVDGGVGTWERLGHPIAQG
jgi:rhodanese-related sulfurtransferase